MYRLRRMRILHPDVMTANTFDGVEAVVNSGETSTIVRRLRSRSDAVTRIITDRQQFAKARTSGTGGSRKGFEEDVVRW